MANYIDGWIWEPTDCLVMHCAYIGRPVRNTFIYRDSVEHLVQNGFIHVIDVNPNEIRIGLTKKGKNTYSKMK